VLTSNKLTTPNKFTSPRNFLRYLDGSLRSRRRAVAVPKASALRQIGTFLISSRDRTPQAWWFRSLLRMSHIAVTKQVLISRTVLVILAGVMLISVADIWRLAALANDEATPVPKRVGCTTPLLFFQRTFSNTLVLQQGYCLVRLRWNQANYPLSQAWHFSSVQAYPQCRDRQPDCLLSQKPCIK